MERLFILLMVVVCSGTQAVVPGSLRIEIAPDVFYIVPANSPVRFVGVDKYGVALFSGEFVLSGHYSYGHDVTDADNRFAATFTISQQASSRLPYYSVQGPIREILLRNQAPFAQQMISEEGMAKLASGQVQSIGGEAIIRVKDLESEVECDHQWSAVQFFGPVKKLGPAVASLEPTGSGC